MQNNGSAAEMPTEAMMMNTKIEEPQDTNASSSASLQITNLSYAHQQYDDFVEIHLPILSLNDFKTKCHLSLHSACAAVFYDKLAHLKDTDFVEIDRSMLEIIGFKNITYHQKDKNGEIKLDKTGNPKFQDMRTDFSHAIRCLRRTAGFVEGSSFDDNDAHFVITKNVNTTQNGGQNKQLLWIRVRALEHFIIMANTSNSYKIREYFLDLKHIMTEYEMYQSVYRAKYDLSLKDSTIGALSGKLDHVIGQNNALLEQNDIQSKKLDMLSRLFYKDTDNKVLDVNTKEKKQELVVLQNKKDPKQCEVLRGQVNHVNHQLKRKQDDMELVGKIDTYKNPINLFNRFSETIKKGGDNRFKKMNNKVTLNDGCSATDLMNFLRVLEDDKHDVAKTAQQFI